MSAEFLLINVEPLTFKVRDPDPLPPPQPLPAYLEKDMVLTLVSGKWPLVDHTDCNRHTFVFKKADGSQFSMLVSGFCWGCGKSKEEQQELLTNGYKIKIIVSEPKSYSSKSENAGMEHPEYE